MYLAQKLSKPLFLVASDFEIGVPFLIFNSALLHLKFYYITVVVPDCGGQVFLDGHQAPIIKLKSKRF